MLTIFKCGLDLAWYFIYYMSMQKIIGVLLIVVGVAMLIWTGFSYTQREKVVDAGPLHISADKQKTVNWPPYAGGVLIVAGVVVLVAGKRKVVP
jgi:drug/metabolite transporter (DMT)-like permease